MLANGSGVFTDYIVFSFGTLVPFLYPVRFALSSDPVHSFSDSLRSDPSPKSDPFNR